jgi:hypothetical protein
MKRTLPLVLILLMAGPAVAQTPPPTGRNQPQAPSAYYPAPPPERAPQVQQGAPITDLKSPLPEGQSKVTRTSVDSEAEAQLFTHALKLAWGRYAKGVKPGEVTIVKQNGLWIVKGRIETEGNWASIDGVVERIAANSVLMRGEVAFRVSTVEKGTPCKVAGSLHFKRSGKSQVWRLVEGDNPCDGSQEKLDLIYAKPVEKKPVPTQPKRS